MTFGSFFAGIGGMDLGLERAGMICRWQVEIDPYCQRVLAKHWPNVERFEDVREVRQYAPVDLIAAGVPCQPVSQAAARSGRGEGWLWGATRRAIAINRPRWFLFENPEAVRFSRRGLANVLHDLTAMGYDAEWRVLPASLFGAPHRRARLWLVADSNRDGEPASAVHDETPLMQEPAGTCPQWPDYADALRVDDGAPNRIHRLRGLGNAVVPQVAEYIGRLIVNEDAYGARRI